MEFRLLGTVCVDTLTGPLPLGPAKRRSLLAALLLRANTPVSMARLTDCLWDDSPPLHARTVIQGHVSRLRALLMSADAEAYGVELATLGDAYMLRAPETLLDSQRFEELLMLAREQRSPADTVLMLKEALSLWQGPALTGTYASAPLQAAAQALEESRLTTVEQLARAYAVLGEHHRAAAVLRAEVTAHPLRESLAAALMTALYRSGRQSEALDRFHRTRRLLADELGIDPGRELADAYAQILRGDPDPADTRDAGNPGAGVRTVAGGVVPAPTAHRDPGMRGGASPAPTLAEAPAAPSRSPRVPLPPQPGTVPHPTDLLPRAPRGFHGRSTELTALSRAAAGEAPICLVTGPAGVGKTALALHWARRSPAAFPDGRLYADLRGFSDTGEPTPSKSCASSCSRSASPPAGSRSPSRGPRRCSAP